jgi:hypothetical protein
MIDLTNKSIDQINTLIQKYTPVLELYVRHHEKHIPILAHIIDLAVNHTKTNHNDLTLDWKVWSVFVVEKNYFNNKINNESDIGKTIDDFIVYWKAEYQGYCNGLGMSASEYDRDRGFVYKYLDKNG